jgi:hypothetical protein
VTIGEIASKAIINTLLGMGTVFAMLLLICFVIYLFKYIPGASEKGQTPLSKIQKSKGSTGNQTGISQEGSGGQKAIGKEEAGRSTDGCHRDGREVLPEMEQQELVAVITAAIMAAQKKEGQASDEEQLWPYVVRSIRRRS